MTATTIAATSAFSPPPRMLVEAPASDAACDYRTLAYVEAYDAVLNDDYAFVAYQEVSRFDPAQWRVRIKSRHTAGAVFEPEQMRLQARSAAAVNKTHFLWGPTLEPSPGDCRCIEFRVHVVTGKPKCIEICLRMRNADGSPGEERSTAFDWPA